MVVVAGGVREVGAEVSGEFVGYLWMFINVDGNGIF